MNKKQSKRQRDIKTKLMAAVCMLLVSSIMMVSTTYAWFTLSTAPEVTGITTAVGANGNLEMALLPLSGDTSEITANQGDSMMSKTAKEANVTWGNLVDLRSGYGLDQIVLYPSELNVVAAEEANTPDKIATTGGILKTPTYGADGRIDKLQPNTLTGVYTDQGGFYRSVSAGETVNDTPMGVRGIGTISSMSPRELAFRLAMSTASTAASQAGGAASAAMSNNGAGVAQIALDHATNNDVYDDNDIQWLINIVDGLLGGNGKTGSVAYMETALKQYILAASIAPTAADANFQTIVDAVNQETVTVYDMADGKIGESGKEVTLTVPSAIAGYITNLQSIKTKLTNAKTTLVDLQSSKNSFDWNEISNPMSTLINIDKVKFEGPDKNEDGLYDEIDMNGALADKMGFGMHVIQKGMVMKMRTGSGIFVELADFCGDFTSSFTMTKVSVTIDDYNATVDELEVTMIADTALTDSTIYLTEARAAVGEFASSTGGSGNSPISDFYGYIIDMAFRTNAANSWLQLQQEGIDRIYSDGTNTNTQGGGASMTFTSGDPDNFSVGKMKDLMSAIKIVFFDPSAENEIVGYAKLDNVNVAKEDATSVTMYLVMCDKAGTALTDAAATQIMQLNQNEIHQLSVLVYLDGNKVGNDDVATTARSMTGSMNLQFSSSANLVAMDYANLKSGNGGALNGGAGEGDDDEPTATEIETVTVNGLDDASAVAYYGTYSGQAGVSAVITGSDGQPVTTGTVTINNQPAAYISGAWVAAIGTQPDSVTIAYTAA